LLLDDSAEFPVGEAVEIDDETYESFQQRWESYTKLNTIESMGLRHGDCLMFEYALVDKDGHL